MVDDGFQASVDEVPWWVGAPAMTDVDELDLPVFDESTAGLSVAEVLLAASLAGPGAGAADLLASLSALTPTLDEWLTAVQLWEAHDAWAAGQRGLALAGFAGPDPVRLDGFRDDEALVLELAMGTRCSESFAYDQISQARLLSSTLVRTGDLLRAGMLSPYRARIIVAELGHLHPDVARRVESQILATAATIPTGTLRRSLSRKVKRADRRAAVDKTLAAVVQGKGRRVEFDPEPLPGPNLADGLMGLYAYLPPVEALAIRQALEQAAGPYRKDDGRLHDERMADALTGMVIGFDPANPTRPVKPKVKVGLLIDLPTLLGLRDHDGELLGYGHLPAEVVRELASNESWQRLVYDPVTGYLLDAGTTVHDLPALREFIPLRDRNDRFPGGTRTTGLDLDHTIAYRENKTGSAPHPEPTGRTTPAVAIPDEGGHTSADNLAALSRRHHRAKTFLGFSYRQLGSGVLEWTTPLGRTYRTYPHDYRPEPDGCGADGDPPGRPAPG